jgi:hypothetical protein
MAIPAAGAIAGILGMFLVVPALGVVAATWRPVLALLAGTDPEPGPQAAVPDGTAGPPAPAIA